MSQLTLYTAQPQLFRPRLIELLAHAMLRTRIAWRRHRRARRTLMAVSHLDAHLRNDIGLPPLSPFESQSRQIEMMLRHR